MNIRELLPSWLKAAVAVSLTVGAGAALAGDAPAAYTKTVMTSVAGKVEYPKMAKMRHQEGVVTVAVTVDGGGAVANAAVEKSSGVESLDNAAIAAVNAAAPFPAPPEAGTVVHGNIRFTAD